MMMQPQEFFAQAWDGYSKLTPDAPKIHSLLTDRGERIVNDHVAFRTFDLPGLGRLKLGAIFERWGYRKAEETLKFPEKKLLASYYLHPDPDYPKLFVSELVLDHVSAELRKWIGDVAGKTPAPEGVEFFLHPQWKPIRFEDYQRFCTESEYAAWTAAFGIQVNHFTVLVNRLKSFSGLPELNAYLEAAGIELNSSGGKIKGSSREHLEQSSTMARAVPCRFAGGRVERIPGCYYEFARRHPLANGELFQGFVPASADKIFESTSDRRS